MVVRFYLEEETMSQNSNEIDVEKEFEIESSTAIESDNEINSKDDEPLLDFDDTNTSINTNNNNSVTTALHTTPKKIKFANSSTNITKSSGKQKSSAFISVVELATSNDWKEVEGKY